METNYLIKKATIKDVSFLADVIIGAEKGTTDKLGLGNLFDISEIELKKLIIAMLEEEIEGCEFSIDSFFVAYFNDEPIAAQAGWLEGENNNLSSSMLKSNLMRATFPLDKLNKVNSRLDMIRDIQIDRTLGTYQLEYTFVHSDHRGKRLLKQLTDTHLNFAKNLSADIKKVQMHVFENNEVTVKGQLRLGYTIVKRYVSDNKDILNFFPFNVKLLMEKPL